MSSGELMALITEKDKTEHKEGKSASIPLVGRVAAGMPIHAEDNIIGYVDIPKRVAEQNDMFALLIKGNSMYPEIKDGDIVVVRKQGFVENRDIAIVRINGEDATCKRIEKTDEGIKWDSPWGKGRPGWHTECCVMRLSEKCLKSGEDFKQRAVRNRAALNL